MEFTNKAPKWDAVGAEPTAELQTKGFTAGYKPPAAYFNYLFNRYTACINELQEITAALNQASTEMAEELETTKTDFTTALEQTTTEIAEDLEAAKAELTTEITALKDTVGDYTGGGKKNILQYETIVNDADYGSYCNVSKDGCITIANTTAASINPETERQMLAAGTYTLSVTSDVAGVRCYFMRGDTVAGQFFTTVGTQTFNYTYDRDLNHKVQFVVPAGVTANLYAQLEEGDTATEFVSHSQSVADVLNDLPTTYVTRAEFEQRIGDINTVLESLIG